MVLRTAFQQSFFLPAPTLTEKNLPSQAGKTCIVTGGNSGVGYELCQILYGADARVFLAGRNATTCNEAIAKIKAARPDSKGSLEFLALDLGDLAGIKASAADFLARSPDALHVLVQNAGVMQPAAGSVGKQGHELQVVTNCLAPYLFAELLRPVMVKTAADEKARGNENVVRVAWAGSLGIDTSSPKDGVTLVKDDKGVETQKVLGPYTDYGQSKVGNLFLAQAWGEEVGRDGIVSVCFNPGNLNTNLVRHIEHKIAPFKFIAERLVHPAIYGAYTELWCGFAKDLTTADNGLYVAPWGRRSSNRADVEKAKVGNVCKRWMEYVKREVAPYR